MPAAAPASPARWGASPEAEAPDTGGRRRFPLVQGLRGAAAFSVVLNHVLDQAQADGASTGLVPSLAHAMPWSAGVDIFFVISGFVIVTSSARLFATARGPGAFLARRLARIVPLYWAMTTLFLLSLAALPGAIRGSMGGAGFVLASYAFVPCARPDGLVQPALGLGWTLNYEMFFYLVFTPFLLLRRARAVAGACLALGLLVAAGAGGALSGVVWRFWSDPIVLEFCAGMGLALLPGRVVLAGAWRVVLVGCALLLLCVQPSWGHRIFAQGMPAIALVAAATLGRPASVTMPFEAALVRLGDASYALYLVHPFVMRGVAVLAHRAGEGPAVAAVTIVLSLVLSPLCALAIHRWFERPANAVVRRYLGGITPTRISSDSWVPASPHPPPAARRAPPSPGRRERGFGSDHDLS